MLILLVSWHELLGLLGELNQHLHTEKLVVAIEVGAAMQSSLNCSTALAQGGFARLHNRSSKEEPQEFTALSLKYWGNVCGTCFLKVFDQEDHNFENG